MKNNEQLTTVELMDMVAMNLREMNSMELTDKKLPLSVNRTKATAMGVKSALQIAIFDAKTRTAATAGKAGKKLQDKVNNGKVLLLK